MVDPLLINESGSEIARLFWENMPFQFTSGFSTMLILAKTIGVVFLIYLVFLIIKSIVNIRQALRMKLIAKNIEEINHKMDLLVGHKNHSSTKKEDKKEK